MSLICIGYIVHITCIFVFDSLSWQFIWRALNALLDRINYTHFHFLTWASKLNSPIKSIPEPPLASRGEGELNGSKSSVIWLFADLESPVLESPKSRRESNCDAILHLQLINESSPIWPLMMSHGKSTHPFHIEGIHKCHQ